MKTKVILFLACVSTSLLADNWPGWRGPTGDGICPDTEAPLSWTLEKNLKWKIKIPGIGHASPIIWEKAIFLVSADNDTGERLLLKLDQTTGKTLWQKTALKAPIEKIHRKNSRASSTPATGSCGARSICIVLDYKLTATGRTSSNSSSRRSSFS